MCLLKKYVYFVLDDQSQFSFDAMKNDLMLTPILIPPDYSSYFLLYLATSNSIVGMVLFQEDNTQKENVIYYLSKNLIGPELQYSHVDNLSLAFVHNVQRLQHYIISRKTTSLLELL